MIRLLLIVFLILFTPAAYAEDDVIHQVYQILAKDYINNIDNAKITLKGLNSLVEIDNNLKIALSGKQIYLYKQNAVIERFKLPQDGASENDWADLSRKVIAKAIEVSDKVELLDFEVPDRFAQAVFADLDGYSHYYGEFAQETPKQSVIRRNYAVRMIGDIMLIKILNFHQGVSRKVTQAVDECSSCRGIILDLRGNHGGILDEAVKITDLFLDEGIIAYTAEKDGKNPKYYTSKAGDILNNKPLAVLIDGFTASAAEVSAAALSEQNRAVLIGTKSFGKGTIQDVVKLSRNRAMALTTAYFYTPSGYRIDKNGLNPAICTGGIRDIKDLAEATCERADHFNEEIEIETAVKYIKNEL